MYNNLTEDFGKIIQPDNLDIELMEHQKTAVYAMRKLEKTAEIATNIIYYDNTAKDLKIETHIGILGDKVGSGKTYMLIALILLNKEVLQRDFFYESSRYITVKASDNNKIKLSSTLIIVPLHILSQWEESLKMTKNIKYTCINNKESKEIPQDYDIILVPVNIINDKYKLFCNYVWNRIIIDEADVAKMNNIDLLSNFIWLVTGTPSGISYTRTRYLKSLFGDNKGWLTDVITVKNNIDFINGSMKLPSPKRVIIECQTPNEIKVVEGFIPGSIINMINAGNIDDAIKTLNCHSDTTENIFQIITKNITRAISNKEIELNAEMKKKYNGDAKIEQEKRIAQIERLIKRLKSRYEALKIKMHEVNDEYCPICMGEFETQTVMDCCGTSFCFECLSRIVNKFGKCPYCSKLANKYNFHVIKEEKTISNSNNEVKVEDKIDSLLKLINKNKDHKMLIFADYINTFKKIEFRLKKEKITYGLLSGNKINEVINNYKIGKINILLLNAKDYGAGLNLQMTDDIIMYHRFTKETEEQIIGRAQRIGREGQLNVYYLIHNNENKPIDNTMFNFSDEEFEYKK